jgi:hypothetical protein
MYQEELLIDYIKAHSSFTRVEVAEENMIDLAATPVSTLPKIYVGHVKTVIENTSDMTANGYDEIANPQLLVTQIQLLCERSALPQVYKELQDSVKDFTPFPNDGVYGNISFLQAEMAAKTGNRVWWNLYYTLQFPRIS